MDRLRRNRAAWNTAARKYVDEDAELREQARSGRSLTDVELTHLRPLLEQRPLILHVQSGNGVDDIELARRGAASVIGVDFSAVTATAAHHRARGSDVPVRYVLGDASRLPIGAAGIDLVYTGKGAVVWLPDLSGWASEIARVLRPGGHVFIFDEHPAAPLWTLDERHAGIRGDRSYFGGTRVNDTFPASAIATFASDPGIDAVEWQWTLADIVTALLSVGLELVHLGEHPDPFWRPSGSQAAAWNGRLPNTFSLLARRAGG